MKESKERRNENEKITKIFKKSTYQYVAMLAIVRA